MSEQASGIDADVAKVLSEMTATSGPVPDLALEAATPLVTLPPDLVALIVGRVRAGATALGADHPRTPITRRIVVPSAALAVLDLIGLVTAATSGHTVLAVLATALFAILAYLAFAGVRFVRQDPLRVTPEQRAQVDAAKTWRSRQGWTDELRAGPWARLVVIGCAATARIAASEAWTWASIAGQRAETELAHVLDGADAEAFALAASGASPPSTGEDTAGSGLVRRVAALRCYADGLDELVHRAARDAELRSTLPRPDQESLGELIAISRSPG